MMSVTKYKKSGGKIMRKKLLLTILLSIIGTTLTVSALSITVNGTQLSDAEPVLVNSRTFVPVATIAKATGANVVWDNETKTVSIDKGETTLKIKIGSKNAVKNDSEVLLDAPAQVIKGKTYVPLSFIASNLGLSVNFDNKTKTVSILDTEDGTIQNTEGTGTTEQIRKEPDSTNNNDTSSNEINYPTGADPEKEGKWIKGNTNSKLYHLPSGKYYNTIAPHNIIWFQTEEQAKALGYREAKQ